LSEISREQEIELKFSLLIIDLHGDLELLIYGQSFRDKLVGVRLMYSLCKEATETLPKIVAEERRERKVVMNKTGNCRAAAAAYLESFLYFILGAFDILASITIYLYPRDQKALSKRYFKDQMYNFIESNINPNYAKLLSKNKDWILKVSKNRDALAHKASASLLFEEDGRVMFVDRKPFDKPTEKKDYVDLLAFLDITYKNVYDFIESYVDIHRVRIPESEDSKSMLNLLEKGLVRQHVKEHKNRE